MSHFSVAVFMTDEKQSLKDLLAPYDESIKVAPYVSDTKAELIQKERQRVQHVFETSYKAWQDDPKSYEFRKLCPDHIGLLKSIPERIKWSDERFYQEAINGEEDNLNENGDLLSTYNPNSKWDCYAIGGQWKGTLILKGEGVKSQGCNEAFVRDIDFEAMRRRKAAKLEPYEKAMKTSYMPESYMRERFPTKEEYIKRRTAFNTYAVVTPDGKWHAPGNMRWFGLSSESTEEEREWYNSYYDRFIKPALDNNWYLVIVDCHI